jgi:hypothetical protein
MSERIHLIIRVSDDGSAYATSPQAPGLVYGRPSLDALRQGLDEVLSFHFGRPGPFDVAEHHERHYDVAGEELVIRLALDKHLQERQEVFDRIGSVLTVPGQAGALVATIKNLVGEAVYVCAVPSDTLDWLAAQLSGPGDAVVAAVTIADNHLLTLPFAEDDGMHPAWQHLASSLPDTSLSDVIQMNPVVTPPQKVPLALS